MNDKAASSDSCGFEVRRASEPADEGRIFGYFGVEIRDRNGEIKFKEEMIPNTITDIGIQELFSVALNNGTAADPWYLGLISGASPSTPATATWGTKTWSEFTSTDEGRIAWSGTGGSATVPNASASNPTRNISNIGSALTFSVNGSGTVGGVFVIDAGGTSTGTLFAHTSITSGPTVSNGDSVLCTYSAVIN